MQGDIACDMQCYRAFSKCDQTLFVVNTLPCQADCDMYLFFRLVAIHLIRMETNTLRVQMGRARAQKCCPNPTRLPWWAGAGRAAQAKHVPTPDPLPKGVGLGLGAGRFLGAQRAPTKKSIGAQVGRGGGLMVKYNSIYVDRQSPRIHVDRQGSTIV
jgi:hypothetical protein